MPTPATTTDTTAWTRLITPDDLRAAVPLTATAADTVREGRATIRRILSGKDDRLLVIVGPCSLLDADSALDYAERLRAVRDSLAEDVVLVMRAYVEKPRSALGWPGLAHAPDLDGPPDPNRGFRLARTLLARITDRTVPVALEWLTTVSPAYLADTVSWGCIGARTVEAPTHRYLASTLDMPIGMKNRTDGAIEVAVNAIRVARHPQPFLGVAPDGSAALARTAGNPDCHLVLRGGTAGPNHHPAAVGDALRQLAAAGLPPRLLIDASHGNCGKDHHRQRAVAGEIGAQIAGGDTAIRGVLLESFLLGGRQDPSTGQPPTRGRSVTDACLSWPVTVEVLTELATAARARRRRPGRPAAPRADARVPEPRTVPRSGSRSVPYSGKSPAAAAVALVQAGLFDTYLVYERAGVWTVAGGCQASLTLDARRVRVRHNGTAHDRPWSARPLASLGAALSDLPIPQWTAYGWVAFEVAHLLSGHPERAGDGDLAHLIVPTVQVGLDPAGATITGADDDLRDRISAVLADVPEEPLPRARATDIDAGGAWYRQAVADAVREIHRGGFDKVILSRSVPVDAEIDFPRSYLLGRAANTPARSFLMDIGGRRAVGFCPETILEAGRDRVVSTQPLAGTRSLGNGPGQDARLRAELEHDPKEIHEHAVSVKLALDELSRVCRPETVLVSEFMTVKPRGRVQHLGSRVRGELAPGRSAWDALEAVFPAVTSSGVPKAAACEYIARTEPGQRGLYSGAVLMATHDGVLDTGLVLRTLFEEHGRRWLRAGAGIVSASRPDREYEETCEKLRSIAPYLVEAHPDTPTGTPQLTRDRRR